MFEPTVRVFDSNTKTIVSMPASELAPGMITVSMDGIEGEVWMDAAQLKSSAFRHEQLPAEMMEQIVQLYSVIGALMDMTADDWVDGFRRDLHPEREIAVWQRIVSVFGQFTNGRDLNYEKRRDILGVVLGCSNASGDKRAALATCNPVTLSRKRVQQIIDAFFI